MTKRIVLHWKQIPSEAAGLRAMLPSDDSPYWQPNVDLCEGEDCLLVRVELAGIAATDVDIRLEEQRLVISGVRRDRACFRKAQYRFHQLEIEYGAFRRMIELPCPVDGAGASASMEAGLLQIEIPRRKRRQAKAVQVKVRS